jgi:myosin protein heavy chain
VQQQDRLRTQEEQLCESKTAIEQAAAREQQLRCILSHAEEAQAQARDAMHALEDQLRDLHATLEHERAQSETAASTAAALAAAEADRFRAFEEELRNQVDAAVAMHSAAVTLHAQQVQDMQAQNGAALEDMRSEHAHEIGDWQRKLLEVQACKAELEESLSVAVQELQADKLEHERALQHLKEKSDADSARITEHADAVKAQLCDKLHEAERQQDSLASSLQHARDEHEKQCAAANAAREEVEQQLAAAESKIEMLSNALKGTEEEKAAALAAISNMYQQTDEQLKAMAAGVQAAPHSDSASRARIATLQAELETSMMERGECLQQLEQLQQSAREAAANALKHRERLEMVEAENKALTDRVGLLQADNDKLSAENVQLVGHSNLKQRINIFNNVKDENNALKKEKNDAERLVAQQKKVIERLQAQSAIGADKENTCLFAKIDQEERLQSALKESEKETRTLRKHLLTLLHHVQTSAANTSLAAALKLNGCDETAVSKEILCDSNKAMKQRDWSSDVRETERIIDALTNHLQQQQREVAGAQLKIHLLEQSARIIAPASSSMAPASVSAGSPQFASFRQKVPA